jgi:histidine ammonia-lyase
MGANAATKCKRVLDNVISVTSLEWLTACQAFDFRVGWGLCPETKTIFEALREEIPFMETDRYLHKDMAKARAILLQRLR